MTRSQRYEVLKQLARRKRAEYGITTSSIGLSAIREVYKSEGIKLDLWKHKLRKVRAAYLVIDGEPHVLVRHPFLTHHASSPNVTNSNTTWLIVRWPSKVGWPVRTSLGTTRPSARSGPRFSQPSSSTRRPSFWTTFS